MSRTTTKNNFNEAINNLMWSIDPKEVFKKLKSNFPADFNFEEFIQSPFSQFQFGLLFFPLSTALCRNFALQVNAYKQHQNALNFLLFVDDYAVNDSALFFHMRYFQCNPMRGPKSNFAFAIYGTCDNFVNFQKRYLALRSQFPIQIRVQDISIDIPLDDIEEEGQEERPITEVNAMRFAPVGPPFSFLPPNSTNVANNIPTQEIQFEETFQIDTTSRQLDQPIVITPKPKPGKKKKKHEARNASKDNQNQAGNQEEEKREKDENDKNDNLE